MEEQVEALTRQVAALHRTVGVLVAWMGQSANSPISPAEAKQLLAMLDATADEVEKTGDLTV